MIDLLKGYFIKCLLVTMTLFFPFGVFFMVAFLIIDNDFFLGVICLLASVLLSVLIATILYFAETKDENKRFIKFVENKLLIYSKKLEFIEEKEFLDISFKNNYFNWVLTCLFDYRIPKSLIITLADNTKLELGHILKKDYKKIFINESVNNK